MSFLSAALNLCKQRICVIRNATFFTRYKYNLCRAVYMFLRATLKKVLTIGATWCNFGLPWFYKLKNFQIIRQCERGAGFKNINGMVYFRRGYEPPLLLLLLLLGLDARLLGVMHNVMLQIESNSWAAGFIM